MINFRDRDSLIDDIKLSVNPEVVNAINCDLPTLAAVQNELVKLKKTRNNGCSYQHISGSKKNLYIRQNMWNWKSAFISGF